MPRSTYIIIFLLFVNAHAGLCQQGTDIRNFGPIGKSQDGSTLKRALAATQGRLLLIPANVTVNATGSYEVPTGTSIGGGGQLLNARLVIRSNTRISGLTFEGPASSIYIDSSQTQSNDQIQGNTFHRASQAIHISGQRDRQASHDMAVSNNSCNDCKQFLYADKVDHSTFTNNVAHVQDRAFLLYGGSNNKISNNEIVGGITGISFVFNLAIAGETGLVSGNLIDGNRISEVREESISFDVRGNEPDHMAVREVDQIAAKTKSSVILAGANWATVGTAMHRLFLCWMGGPLEGVCLRSIGGANATFALDANQTQIAAIRQGDEVVVGAPFSSNAIYRNVIQINPANTNASGILLWGLAYDNAICGNIVASPTANVKISGIGVMSLNGLDDRGGVTSPAGGRKAPSENNLVSNNRISNLRLQLGYQDWGHQVHYAAKGNTLFGNSVIGGVLDIRDQAQSQNGISKTLSAQSFAALSPELQQTVQKTGGQATCGMNR